MVPKLRQPLQVQAEIAIFYATGYFKDTSWVHVGPQDPQVSATRKEESLTESWTHG